MKHVPNLLTLLRLMLVPVVWKMMWVGAYDTGLYIGIVATASDAIDGWVARKFSATSKLGAMLDPIADKLLLSGTYLILGHRQEIPPWLVWIVIGRDIFILLFALVAYLFTKIREFPPSRWGKLTAFTQIITLLVILVNRAIIFDVITYKLEHWMILFCAAMTIGSALHYSWLAINGLGATNSGITDRIA